MSGESTLRRTGIRLIAIVLIAACAFVALPAQPAEAGFRGSERRMAYLINRARAARGLPKLKLDQSLTYRARRHSVKMMRRGAIFHSNLRTTLRGIRWRVAGENVGMGPSIPVLHRAFMHSPGHRANNLYRRYRKVGVGVRIRNGVVFVTVLFTG